MNLYTVVLTAEIEADNEEDATRIAIETASDADVDVRLTQKDIEE